MPSAQVVNLNPPARTETTPLEKTLSGFAKRNRENQLEADETDALREIYAQYQNDGMNLENQIKAIQTKPGISPTTRVNTIKQLTEFQKHNNEVKKETEKELKALDKKNKDIASLRASGANDQQIALYEASPVGGQTKIVEDIIDQNNRKKSPPGIIPENFEDFDVGLTPKERVKRQEARYSVQTPLLIKNSEMLTSLQNEGLSVDLLGELNDSGKVGQGVHNLNINPKTGDLIIPKLGTPEEQLFVKTINDFTVKAKDSFGARVTNFELDRFMQRLPTLANSEEGRRLILRQMKIINELNSMEKKEIQTVFDQYGVRNIDYVDAENKAREKIKDRKEELRKEFVNIEQLAKKEDDELIRNVKSKVQPGYTALRVPGGGIKQFPSKNVPNLLEKGYKEL